MNSQGVAIDKTLVERLDILIKDDHERGCQGCYYSCTCGYDNDCSQAMQDAKSRIEALEAALRNIQALAKKRQAEGGPDGNLKAIEGFAKQALESKP